MGDGKTEAGDSAVRFRGLAMFGESGAERLGRWRPTFHRLRDTLAEPPADADLDRMIQRLGQIEFGRSSGE